MDIQSIVAELGQEASRSEPAVAALVRLGSRPARRGRPPKVSRAKPASGPKHRHMSAAARKRISTAMKQRWAKWKGKSAPKQIKAAPKQPRRRPHLSAAAKKRLSELMKARWAERKKAA